MLRFLQFTLRILGIALAAGSIYYGVTANEIIGKGHWIHTPSLVIVIGCLGAYVLVAFQFRTVVELTRVFTFQSPTRLEDKLQQVGSQLKKLSDEYYARGPSALSSYATNSAFPEIWGNILSQLEAKVPAKDVRMMLQYDAKRFQDHYSGLIQSVSSLASASPSIGMLGTVIGLVRLLSELDNMAALGPNMALAMLTTLYGIFFNILIFTPLLTRLQTLRELGQKAYNQAMYWVYLVENQKPTFYLETQSLGQTVHETKKVKSPSYERSPQPSI